MQDTFPKTKIQQIAIFRGMSSEELKIVVEAADPVEFEFGEVILREGKQSQNIWIAVEGDCEVVKRLDDGEETVLATLRSPSIFGEMSFFNAAPHSATVRSLGTMRTLQIRRKRYDQLVEQDCCVALKLASNLANVLAERLRRMDQRVAELIGDQDDDRKRNEWRDFRSKLYGDWNI